MNTNDFQFLIYRSAEEDVSVRLRERRNARA